MARYAPWMTLEHCSAGFACLPLTSAHIVQEDELLPEILSMEPQIQDVRYKAAHKDKSKFIFFRQTTKAQTRDRLHNYENAGRRVLSHQRISPPEQAAHLPGVSVTR